METLFLFAVFLLPIVSGLVCWECENVFTQKECLEKGKAVKCMPNQDQCHLELRHGGWGNHSWIEKSCKTTKSCENNYIQNRRRAWAQKGDQVQCNEFYPSSVCRCCCSTDLCNQDRTSCLGIAGSCPAIKPLHHGSMTCRNGFELTSQCEFKCHRRYFLVGQPVLTCSPFGKWNYKRPRCKILVCMPRLKTPKRGTKKCTNGVRLGSKCRFTCGEGFRLIGPSTLTCIDDRDGDSRGVWNYKQPFCKALKCPKQRPLRHGKISCTRRNRVGSACEFICDAKEGYALYPPLHKGVLNCLPNERWDQHRPCCTLPCPPFAIMDFLVILDSSSSVGLENWKKVTSFVESFMKDFTIRPDATQFAAFRYYRRIDTRNQILFKSHPNSLRDNIDAFNAMPYDGSGTNTGMALDYATDVVLRLGNRPLARDVVLLITDGKSQDNVAFPARRLRKTGAVIYVLPIQNPGTTGIDLKQIEDIAGSGNDDNILREALERGFDALDQQFAKKIISLLCSSPCFNPLHGHPNDAFLP